MQGMNRATGKSLSDIAHLKQSITDILTTPVGTRIMRPDYGSRLYELLDRPVDDVLRIDMYAETAEALARWERRFRLQRVELVQAEVGRAVFNLHGIYLPTGAQIALENIEVV